MSAILQLTRCYLILLPLRIFASRVLRRPLKSDLTCPQEGLPAPGLQNSQSGHINPQVKEADRAPIRALDNLPLQRIQLRVLTPVLSGGTSAVTLTLLMSSFVRTIIARVTSPSVMVGTASRSHASDSPSLQMKVATPSLTKVSLKRGTKPSSGCPRSYPSPIP